MRHSTTRRTASSKASAESWLRRRLLNDRREHLLVWMEHPEPDLTSRHAVDVDVDPVMPVLRRADLVKWKHEWDEVVLARLKASASAVLDASDSLAHWLAVGVRDDQTDFMRDVFDFALHVNEQSQRDAQRSRKLGSPHSRDTATEDVQQTLSDRRRVAEDRGLDPHRSATRRG